MGRLGPLTSLALGRSPYDDVVPGEGPENPRGHQQMYDEGGRPINPETKRINKDVIRSHNEVMMVIGVAEPENGTAEAQAEAARKHHQYEDRIGRRLLLLGGVLETAGIWGINGMRQRILLYRQFSQLPFLGMMRAVWNQQSLSSYFFGGLPSFLTGTILEQLAVPRSRKYPVVQYIATYIRLHLAIYTFFQRAGIIPLRNLLPNWRFFVPGTRLSPIPIPPLPTSLRPRSFLQWLGAVALSVAPFAGFYLYTKLYSLITRTLRFKIYRLLPRPYNANKRRLFRDAASHQQGADLPMELRTDDPLQTLDPGPATSASDGAQPSGGGASQRRQSTISVRGSGPAAATTDDFASDDEDAEIINATLISFDVESAEPTPEPTSDPHDAGDDVNAAANNTNNNGNNGNGNNTPGVWSAELRPNPVDGGRPGGQREPVYRETALTRLPAVLATDVLAITPARLLMTPLAALVWPRLARPYMARLGLPLEGVVHGPGLFAPFAGRGLVNLLGLELLLAVLHGEAWAAVMLVAERFRFSEEEWNEREGIGKGE